MSDPTPPTQPKFPKRVVAAAAVVGALVGAAGIANAAVGSDGVGDDSITADALVQDDTSSTTTPVDETTDVETADETASDDDHVGTEEELTGDLATQVTAAAEAAVPGGTIDRVETDDHGAAYEAHTTDADGNRVTVTFDENLDVVEIIEGQARPGKGGRRSAPTTATS